MRNIAKVALKGLGRMPFARPVGLLLMRWVLVTLPLSSPIRELIVWPLATYILGNDYQSVVRLHTGPTMMGTLDNPIGRSILFYGQATGYVHEPHTLRLALWLLKPSGRVIHAGAHIGYHAVHLAQAVQPGGGHVFAFEPVTDHYAQLKRNCELSKLDNLVAEHMALNGVSQKHIQIQVAGARSTLIQNDLVKAGVIEEVESVSLNDYAGQRDLKSVELIFLDIEGSELNVLSGAEKLLNSQPDLIFSPSSLSIGTICTVASRTSARKRLMTEPCNRIFQRERADCRFGVQRQEHAAVGIAERKDQEWDQDENPWFGQGL